MTPLPTDGKEMTGRPCKMKQRLRACLRQDQITPGYGPEAAEYTVSAPRTGMRYLTAEDAERVGITCITVPVSIPRSQFDGVDLQRRWTNCAGTRSSPSPVQYAGFGTSTPFPSG